MKSKRQLKSNICVAPSGSLYIPIVNSRGEAVRSELYSLIWAENYIDGIRLSFVSKRGSSLINKIKTDSK